MSAKAKKLARKAATAAANEHAATVRAANALADPLAPLPAAARAFTLPAAAAPSAAAAMPIRLVSSPASALGPGLLDALHVLCRANMEELYAPVWGAWDEPKKRRQLADDASRFILAYAAASVEGEETAAAAAAPAPAPAAGAAASGAVVREDSSSPEDQGDAAAAAAAAANSAKPQQQQQQQQQELVAFVNYRFELDDGGGTGRGPALPVAYCYELQLSPGVQRRGLGRRMMRALELAAARAGMRGVVLTVQDANAGALALYASLGYGLDPYSPDPEDPEEARAGYRILRKDFPEAVVAAAAAAARAAAVGAAATGTKEAPAAAGETRAPAAAVPK